MTGHPTNAAPHSLPRRWLAYGRLVAGNGFALGNALFGVSAAYLNLSTTLSGAASAALFAAGGAVDALQIVASDIQAYRRRHHPGLRGQKTPPRLYGALERVLAVPGLGQALLGSGAATLFAQAIGTGAYQMAAGVGLLMAGHTAFAGATAYRAIRDKRRARTQAPSTDRAPSRTHQRTRPSLARSILRDPMALGAILVGAASATLPFTATSAGLAAAALCVTGGIAQAVLKHRALARRTPRPPTPRFQAPHPQAPSRRITRVRAAAGAALGYALQAVGLATAAAFSASPGFQLALSGFAVALTAVAAGTVHRAMRAPSTTPARTMLTTPPSGRAPPSAEASLGRSHAGPAGPHATRSGPLPLGANGPARMVVAASSPANRAARTRPFHPELSRDR